MSGPGELAWRPSFFLTYTAPDPETREPRPSLILRYFGGSFDIAEFDDSHLLPQREAVPEGEDGLGRFDQIIQRDPQLFVSRNLMGNVLLMSLIPRYELTLDRSDLAACNRAALRLMGALRIHEAREGQLPRTLDELAPFPLKVLPVDPFTGVAFRYSADERRLWTPGSDGVDAGGKAKKPGQPGRYLAHNRYWKDPTIRLRWRD